MGRKRQHLTGTWVISLSDADGSARVQTVDRQTSPRFHRLLEAFREKTGCPILVNTSFNVRGEPIVCTPEDAIRCMANSQIDCLVLEDMIIDKEHIPAFLRSQAKRSAPDAIAREDVTVDPRLSGSVERWRPADGALPLGVYTFV
jgi:carbamoyltransferase